MATQAWTHQTIDESACWTAVQERDSSYDGTFVYAVRSTGIYCRPTCPSRRPQRSQVLFFPQTDQAQDAGFRPCLRCRPDEHVDPQLAVVEEACRAIDESPDTALSLEELGRTVHMSPYHLQRTFKRVTGLTPRQYAEARRLERFKGNLKSGQPVTVAIYDAGYSSTSRVYERAPAHLGMTPSRYRRGADDVPITYAVVDCRLGRLLVAATERGICSVKLGNRDAELEADLRTEFPGASLQRDDSGLTQWVGPLVAHLEGEQPHLDLPLDVQATAFQWRVWHELQAIPYGGTRTYKDVAAAIGQPSAARAVARACATNPVAVAVPCHRVVRGDGGLGGYRWGLERKRALLEHEQG